MQHKMNMSAFENNTYNKNDSASIVSMSYQLKILTRALLGGIHLNRPFRLATEMNQEVVGKFDDMTFMVESDENPGEYDTLLLQVKHNEKKQITRNMLLNVYSSEKKTHFSIVTYLYSYLNAVKHNRKELGNVKELVLYVNQGAGHFLDNLFTESNIEEVMLSKVVRPHSARGKMYKLSHFVVGELKDNVVQHHCNTLCRRVVMGTLDGKLIAVAPAKSPFRQLDAIVLRSVFTEQETDFFKFDLTFYKNSLQDKKASPLKIFYEALDSELNFKRSIIEKCIESYLRSSGCQCDTLRNNYETHRSQKGYLLQLFMEYANCIGVRFSELDKHNIFYEEQNFELQDKDITDFIDKFVLCLEQPSEEEQRDMIKEEVKNLVLDGSLDTVADLLHCRIEDWFKQKSGRYLNEHDGKNIIQEINMQLSSGDYLRRHNVECHNSDEELDNICLPAATCKETLSVVLTDCVQFAMIKLYSIVKSHNRLNKCLFINKDIEACALRTDVECLFIDYLQFEGHNVQMLLAERPTLTFVLISLYDTWFKSHTPTSNVYIMNRMAKIHYLMFSFADIAPSSCQHLFSRCRVSFMGNISSLCELIELEEFGRFIDASAFAELINITKMLEIGKPPQKVEESNACRTKIMHLVCVTSVLNMANRTDNDYEVIFTLENQKSTLFDFPISKNIVEDDFLTVCKTYSHSVNFLLEVQDSSNVLLKEMYNPNLYIERDIQSVIQVWCGKTSMKNIVMSRLSVTTKLLLSNIASDLKLKKVLDLTDDEYGKVKEFIVTIETTQDCVKLISDECATNSILHWFHWDEEKFVWKQSSGCLGIVRECCEFSYDNFCEKQFLLRVKKDKVVLISDEPGAGKTTTITSLMGGDLSRNNWIIYINLSQHWASCSFDNPLTDLTSVIDFLTQFPGTGVDPESCLSKSLFKYNLISEASKYPIIFFFDAVDEILPKSRERLVTIIDVLSKQTACQVWVITKSQVKTYLEDSFGAFSHGLVPLDDRKCNNYFHHFTNCTLPLVMEKGNREIFNHMLKYYNGILAKPSIAPIIHFPLHLRILVEYTLDNLISSAKGETNKGLVFPYDVCQLYHLFIQTKYRIYFREKTFGCGLHSIHLLCDISELCFSEAHRIWALKYLFPAHHSAFMSIFHNNMVNLLTPHKLAPIGIIVTASGSIQEYSFFHRIFAEYFCATLFCQILELKSSVVSLPLKDLVISVLDEIFINENKESYQMTLLFVNNMLTAHSPFLRDIVNCNEEAVLHAIHLKEPDMTLKDCLGRGPLHFASQIGSVAIIMKLSNAGYSFLEKDAFGRLPLHYAARNNNLDIVNLVLWSCVGESQSAACEYMWLLEVETYSSISRHCHIVNERDTHGKTSLYYAAKQQCWDVCVSLVLHGAHIDQMENPHKVSMFLSCVPKNEPIAMLILFQAPDLLNSIIEQLDAASQLVVLDSIFTIHCQKLWCLGVQCINHHNIPYVASINLIMANASCYQISEEKHVALYKDVMSYIGCHSIEKDQSLEHMKCFVYRACLLRHYQMFVKCVEAIKKVTNLKTCGILHNSFKGAILSGAINILEYMLMVFGPTVRDEFNNTPLHIAAGMRGNLSVLHYFLDSNMDVNNLDALFQTPLHISLMNQDPTTSQFLLSRGGKPSCFQLSNSKEDLTAFGAFISTFRKIIPIDLIASLLKEIIEQMNLKKQVPDLLLPALSASKWDANDAGLLHRAVELDEPLLAIYLIMLGADIHRKDSMGRTPVELARTNNMLVTLFSHGASYLFPNEKIQDMFPLQHQTVLDYFDNKKVLNLQSTFGDRLILLLLVAAVKEEDGSNIVHVWVKNGDIHSLSNMIVYMDLFDIMQTVTIAFARNNEGCTPLHIAVRASNVNLALFLVSMGHPVDSEDSYQMTPYQYALRHGNLQMIEILGTYDTYFKRIHNNDVTYVAKTQSDIRSHGGRTALHLAVDGGQLEMVKALMLQANNNVDVFDCNGNSLLHLAHSMEMVKAVLQCGCRFNSMNRQMLTPEESSHNPSIKSFLKHLTILFNFIQHTESRNRLFVDFFNKLEEKYPSMIGSMVRSRDSAGRTLLDWAVFFNEKCLIVFLISKGSPLTKNAHIIARISDYPLQCALKFVFSLFNNSLPCFLLPVLEKTKDRQLLETCVNVTDDRGNTPLHLCDNVRFTKCLLEWGARPDTLNMNNQLPIVYRMLASHQLPIIKILFERNPIQQLTLDQSQVDIIEERGNLSLEYLRKEGVHITITPVEDRKLPPPYMNPKLSITVDWLVNTV